MIKDRLKKLRTEEHLTQKDIAEKLKISVTGYASWEQGRTEPNSTYLMQLSKIFNVTTDYILGLEDEYGNKIDSNGDIYVKVVARSPGNKVKPHYEKLTPEDIKFFEEILEKLKKQ